MTLRQIKDSQSDAIPFNRAGFVSHILEPYMKEAKRTNVHTDHRRMVAWSVAQALRDLRHLCDSMNADFDAIDSHAKTLHAAEAIRTPRDNSIQPRIESVDEIPKTVGSTGTPIPKPSSAVKQVQSRLATIIASKKRTPEDDEARESCGRALRAEFMKAFGLEEDRGKVAEKLYERWSTSPLKPQSELFDHPSFFRRGKNVVVVSQPYGIEAEELIRWAKDVSATFIVASDWGFYYPGHASLFFVEFTPKAKDDFDARIRALCR